jgi:polyhydroxyalkanoate synthase
MAWGSLRAALPALEARQLPWPAPLADQLENLRAEFLAGDLSRESQSPADRLSHLGGAIDRAGERRMLDFTAGVRAYREHSYRRDLAEPPAIWRDGTTRLLDYGAPRGRSRGAVLVVPSLVNRAYVLDLTEKTSLMRHLARQGFRPFLVDWDAPGPGEKSFGLDDYIAGRLEGALDAAVAAHGGPVAALGYCMGGNLALALALRRPRDVTGLACLATPWDFHAAGPISAPLEPPVAANLAAAIAALPEFPVDLLQAMFASLDPFLVNRKYRAFGASLKKQGTRDASRTKHKAAGIKAEDADTLFVAIEDWVNDAVPLASKVASECLVGWYGGNAPLHGRWQVAGRAVRPSELQCPALAIIPARDRIVPPASAMALAAAMPQAQIMTVPSGHVAMVVGEHGPRLTWDPLVEWLASLAGGMRSASTRNKPRNAGKRGARARKPVAKRSRRPS